MPEVICFANMKGGVGKTTLCVNLAYALFSQRKKVLLIDNDPQFNASSSLIKPARYIKFLKDSEKNTIYRIYEKEPRLVGGVTPTVNPKSFIERTWFFKGTDHQLDVIPSQIELYETLKNPTGKEYRLNKFLKENAQDYDYILIDCPPTPSVLTHSAFMASRHVVIPITPDYYAAMGLPQFLSTLSEFKDGMPDEHDVRVLGAVFTNVPQQETSSSRKARKSVISALNKHGVSINILKSEMITYQAYRKAVWDSNPVQQLKGKGSQGKTKASRDIRNIAAELLELIKHRNGTTDEDEK